ncbi:hypothetical protein [Methanorbis rubei]|uniref:DUF3821 domain-containing protein n=1 Tax=Methanorbis rubei TaxID=3028300 RepID=A0AAE4MFB3_9EURY|nr:hypothetical protein [Methanocorpusculaceae archaeon Cs1]
MKKLFFAAVVCAVLIFSAGVAADEEYWITIDPIPDQMLGSTYIINGETNLPVGSKLFFEHYWADWECHDTRVCCKPINSGETSNIIQVQQGTGDANVWSFIMDTSEFGYARKFLAKVTSFDTDFRTSTTYNLIERTPETSWIMIDPIPDQNVGANITITGSVFQPQEGMFLIDIQPIWFDHNTAPDTTEARPFVKYILVTVPKGTTEFYNWSISLDTATLPTDVYQVKASGLDYDFGSQTRTFILRGDGEADSSVIDISPVKSVITGDPLIIQGSINTGKETTLLYELVPNRVYYSVEDTRTGYTRTTPLRAYGKDRNTVFWEVSLDTAGLPAGEYLLKVYVPDAPVTAEAEVTLQSRSSVPVPTQTPGFGLGILVLAFTAAVVLSLLRKK